MLVFLGANIVFSFKQNKLYNLLYTSITLLLLTLYYANEPHNRLEKHALYSIDIPMTVLCVHVTKGVPKNIDKFKNKYLVHF